VGDGVATSSLAGRTLCDLVLGRDTELTRLPWVGRGAALGAEPLRYSPSTSSTRCTAPPTAARITAARRPSAIARFADKLSGRG
jgi:hypothetical protein